VFQRPINALDAAALARPRVIPLVPAWLLRGVARRDAVSMTCKTLLVAFLGVTLAASAETPASQHSPLDQIDRDNVARLRVAWTYRSGEPTTPLPGRDQAPAFEATPVYAAGLLYIGTPYGKAIALDAETGKERWSFDARIDPKGNYGDFANRGVSFWADPSERPEGACRQRIFFASIDARLFALDAASGALCRDFGNEGHIDLTRGLRRGPEYVGDYQQTSPPAVIGDLVIVVSAIADNTRADGRPAPKPLQ
jgi:quinoprotein glucose dehydrogenase